MELWNSLIEEKEPITLEDIKLQPTLTRCKKQLTLIIESTLTTKKILKNKL
jgi:hypothetical protein